MKYSIKSVSRVALTVGLSFGFSPIGHAQPLAMASYPVTKLGQEGVGQRCDVTNPSPSVMMEVLIHNPMGYLDKTKICVNVDAINSYTIYVSVADPREFVYRDQIWVLQSAFGILKTGSEMLMGVENDLQASLMQANCMPGFRFIRNPNLLDREIFGTCRRYSEIQNPRFMNVEAVQQLIQETSSSRTCALENLIAEELNLYASMHSVSVESSRLARSLLSEIRGQSRCSAQFVNR